MINNEQNRKAIKAALKSTSKKTKVAVPEPGTFCQAGFCSDEAKSFVEGRPICNIHKASCYPGIV